MQRRRFLSVAATTAGGLGFGSATTVATDAAPPSRPMRFYSAASQLAADYTPLSDPTIPVVWAESTASNAGSSRGVGYDGPIPLVSVDGAVAGFGAMLVPDAGRFDASENFEYHNAEAVLGIWDALLDGGDVRWDESHGQYWNLEKFERFAALAADRGYDVAPASAIDGRTLADAAGLVITTPPRALEPAELDALAAFVADGGALFLHDQADFRGLDATAHLNAIAERLDLAFRFNADGVVDETHNAGAEFAPLTARYAGPLVR
ncbi:DUF4350 domain-containing protein [Halalkalicoccus sp. GCM10025322]|uniref:DUF4350 domain-containing protein n=2 Tax=Halococcaceae TaxID=1963270 RepID=UPI002F9631D8